MGWWNATPQGGIDWEGAAKKAKPGTLVIANALEDEGRPMVGDGPADIIDHASMTGLLYEDDLSPLVADLHAEYQAAWGRKATDLELRLCFRFCGPGAAKRYNEYVKRTWAGPEGQGGSDE